MLRHKVSIGRIQDMATYTTKYKMISNTRIIQTEAHGS